MEEVILDTLIIFHTDFVYISTVSIPSKATWAKISRCEMRWDALSFYNIYCYSLMLFRVKISLRRTLPDVWGQWIELRVGLLVVTRTHAFWGEKGRVLTRCPGHLPSWAQWILPPEIPPCSLNWIWYSSWLPGPDRGPRDCGAAAEQLLHSTTKVLCMASHGGQSERLMHSLDKVSACKMFGDSLGWKTLGRAERQ